MIPIRNLKKMFIDIKKTTNWELANDMLWGYFFTCQKIAILERLRDSLAKDGYRFVELRLNEPEQIDDNDATFYWLHVEKVEIHTVKTLNERNKQLLKLAANHNAVYDGMDVGPVKET